MVTVERTGPVAAQHPLPRTPVWGRTPTALWVGVAVALVDYIGAGIPSYWGDEAASVISGTRSLPSLVQELSAVDAVHGVYYFLLHGWMTVFGTGEWATRALSSIGIGLLAAGTYTLGTMWFTRRIALIAAALIAIIPRASLLAVETRGYALSAAAAAWLAVGLIRLVERDARRRRWVLWGVLMGLASWFFLYLLLLPLALAPAIWVARRRGAVLRNARAAAVTTGAVAVPIVVLAAFQRGQLSFLSHRSYLTPLGVFVTPWFGQLTAAVVLWALLIAGVLLQWRRRETRTSVVMLVLWVTVPAIALIGLDVLVSPTYNPRYLSFGLAAVALLIALGVSGLFDLLRSRVRRYAGVGVALVAVAVLGVTVPQYLHQRTPFAKDGGADFQYVAQVMGQRAHPGDAVLFGDGPRPSRTSRLAYRLYPQDFTGLADPQLITSYDEKAGLWDTLASVSEVSGSLPQNTVWLLETHGALSETQDRSALLYAGYRLVATDSIHRTTVYEYQRGS